MNFRNHVYGEMLESGKDMSQYDKTNLMDAIYDGTELRKVADEKIRTFQIDGAR